MIQHNNYLIYQEGNTNLILSAPHCGDLKPTSIPDRTWGTTVRDTYTKTIMKGLLNYFSGSQYFIYSGIHRSKIDLNRDVKEAAQGNKRMELTWKVWNDTLDFFTYDSLRKYGRTLYVDIHSHNNSDEIQLGYALSKTGYIVIKNGGKTTEKSSLDGLGHDTYEMLFGNKSLKSYLERRGRGVYNPTPKQQYFDGGFNIRRHQAQGMGSIQIEIPVSICENGTEGVVEDLGYAISRFKKVFVDGYNNSDTIKL